MAKNTTILEGIILNEPTLRNTKSGVDVSNFILKVEEPGPKRSFVVNITSWGKKAIECALLKKGESVRVSGEIGVRTRVFNKFGVSETSKAIELQADSIVPMEIPRYQGSETNETASA